jgi:hypothetical protein
MEIDNFPRSKDVLRFWFLRKVLQWRRLVSWITKKPIPITFVDELPPPFAEVPLPD